MPAVRIKDHWREQRLFDQRSLICAVLMALATLGLLARLFVLQVNRHDYYAELSQGNRVRTEPIPAARGLILDRSGEIMAGARGSTGRGADAREPGADRPDSCRGRR
jgi:penicillin-binding protein 2